MTTLKMSGDLDTEIPIVQIKETAGAPIQTISKENAEIIIYDNCVSRTFKTDEEFKNTSKQICVQLLYMQYLPCLPLIMSFNQELAVYKVLMTRHQMTLLNFLSMTNFDDDNKQVLAQIMVQIAYVEQFFKAKGITHNDVKLDNILVDFTGDQYTWVFDGSTKIKTNFGKVVFIDFSFEEKQKDNVSFLGVLKECGKKIGLDDSIFSTTNEVFEELKTVYTEPSTFVGLNFTWNKNKRAPVFYKYTLVSNCFDFSTLPDKIADVYRSVNRIRNDFIDITKTSDIIQIRIGRGPVDTEAAAASDSTGAAARGRPAPAAPRPAPILSSAAPIPPPAAPRPPPAAPRPSPAAPRPPPAVRRPPPAVRRPPPAARSGRPPILAVKDLSPGFAPKQTYTELYSFFKQNEKQVKDVTASFEKFFLSFQ
jgi:hypothetical protein